MSNNEIQLLTPPGRIVLGNPHTGNKTDAEGKPLVVKTGLNAGQPRVNYYVGLAIEKTHAEWSALYSEIYNRALQNWPQFFNAQQQCILPTFAWKITDGDSIIPNKKGTKPSDKEGHPGHWILNLSDGFAPKCYKHENGGWVEIVDNSIKCGDYIRCSITVKPNGSDNNPGIFLNLKMVEFLGYGTEIVNGPSPDQVFGSATRPALPAGASAAPTAPTTTVGAGMTPPGAGMTPGAAMTPPSAPDLIEVKYITSDGGQWTADQLKAVNYTDDQIARLQKI